MHGERMMITVKINPATIALLGAGLIVAAAWSWPRARADEPRASGPAQLPDARHLSPGDDASVLVRSIREQEAWVDRVESLALKAEVLYKTTPAGVAKRRSKLREQLIADELIEKNRGLRPRATQTIELAFDRKRVRWWDRWDPDFFELWVWDGNRMITFSSYDTPPNEREYRIRSERGTLLSGLTYCLGFAGPRRLWWAVQPEELEATIRLMGKAEDFVYGGRAEFHGTECHVVSRWANWTTFYITVADGRLRGAKHGAQKNPEKRLVNLFNRKGHAFQDGKELSAWFKSRTPAEAAVVEREKSANLARLVDPIYEQWLSDYREVAPGCWLPMTQASNLFFMDEDDRLAIEETHELKITELKVNVPLPDVLFRVEIPEGAKINDQTKKASSGKRED
jgi:hypothetical protein